MQHRVDEASWALSRAPSSAASGPDVPLSSVVGGPKKKEIESCTRKCVPTCIRGGEGRSGDLLQHLYSCLRIACRIRA